MPKRVVYDKKKFDDLRKAQLNVVTRHQAKACGMPPSTIGHQTREGGPWQVMLPGIYLTVTGPVLREHREMAALLHSGADGLLTGWSAVRHHGLAAPESINVHVLVPLNIHRQSIDFSRLHRTKRMPNQHEEAGPI